MGAKIDSARGETTRATLLLCLERERELTEALAAMAEQLPHDRRYLSAEELAQRFGASAAQVEAVRTFAARHRLEVTAVNAAGRSVQLAGTPERFEKAFGLTFRAATHRGRTFRRPERPVAVPPELEAVVEGVFGLDELPCFRREFRGELAATPPDLATGEPGKAAPRFPSPHDVAHCYQFPSPLAAGGETVGIVLLGGGFYQQDLDEFFGGAGPELSVVEVSGQGNDPAPKAAVHKFLDELAAGKSPSGDPHMVDRIWWTLEATVDIELAGSFAPNAHLVAYFAPNHDAGKIDALVAALTDGEHDLSVISCSWGMCEIDADATYLRSLDRLFQLAALRGITLCYSSGDKGADQAPGGEPRVHFPASSPHVLSCGGTSHAVSDPAAQPLAWDESRPGKVLATGGGFSQFFERPAWQHRTGHEGAGRGVPDVSGKADYANGYLCRLAGRGVLGGGTSVAVPMWAGLVACLNHRLGGRCGWLTPLLYHARMGGVLTDVFEGNNGLYDAVEGWDATTGLGSPRGETLLRALLTGGSPA